MDYGIGDILTLLGSLGLFLYGMKVMSDSLLEVAGDRMRSILASMTSNRVFAIFTGFVITSVIQSSSATTLMVVSFANAALLSLTEAVGVIMGANIGTTVTAWLITILGFKVSMSAIALPLVALGFLLTFSKKIRIQHWGTFVIGFSVLFIGLQFLKDAVPDINDNPEILEWLTAYTDLGFVSVLIFLGIGTLLTMVLQSSSATMALTLIMCYQGWIPFQLAAAMVLGENIGTTITANLAALVANFQAKRTARAHLIFNLLGVIWMLILFQPFLRGVDLFLATTGAASPFAETTAIPVALSVFHTAFNLINTFLLAWFVPLIVRIVEWMIPAKVESEPEVDHPKFLTENALNYPQTAISALRKESQRLLEGAAFKIVAHASNLHRSYLKSDLKPSKIVKASTGVIPIDINDVYYSKVKSIFSSIIEYATRVEVKFNLSDKKMAVVNQLKIANRNIVLAVKEAYLLKGNFDHFMVSDNDHIRKEYDRLRKKVARVLQEIHLTGSSANPQDHLERLETIRIKTLESDILVDGTLDQLIRRELITSQMASSLVNDSNTVSRMIKHLVQAAELLYIKSDPLLTGLPDDSSAPEKKKSKKK
jgi:phosphate:Na+ symporter